MPPLFLLCVLFCLIFFHPMCWFCVIIPSLFRLLRFSTSLSYLARFTCFWSCNSQQSSNTRYDNLKGQTRFKNKNKQKKRTKKKCEQSTGDKIGKVSLFLPTYIVCQSVLVWAVGTKTGRSNTERKKKMKISSCTTRFFLHPSARLSPLILPSSPSLPLLLFSGTL